MALGYEDEKAFWTAKGFGRSTWYSMTRLAEDFCAADEEDFLRMKVYNAKELAKLEPELRYEPELMQRAAVETYTQFADSLLGFKADRDRTNVTLLERRCSEQLRMSKDQPYSLCEHGLGHG